MPACAAAGRVAADATRRRGRRAAMVRKRMGRGRIRGPWTILGRCAWSCLPCRACARNAALRASLDRDADGTHAAAIALIAASPPATRAWADNSRRRNRGSSACPMACRRTASTPSPRTRRATCGSARATAGPLRRRRVPDLAHRRRPQRQLHLEPAHRCRDRLWIGTRNAGLAMLMQTARVPAFRPCQPSGDGQQRHLDGDLTPDGAV